MLPFVVKTQEIRQWIVLAPCGRLDTNNAPMFGRVIEEVVAGDCPRIILNCAAVTFIDSTALTLLISTKKRCEERGGELRLTRVKRPVSTVLEMTKLEVFFAIYETVQEAVKGGDGIAPADPHPNPFDCRS